MSLAYYTIQEAIISMLEDGLHNAYRLECNQQFDKLSLYPIIANKPMIIIQVESSKDDNYLIKTTRLFNTHCGNRINTCIHYMIAPSKLIQDIQEMAIMDYSNYCALE